MECRSNVRLYSVKQKTFFSVYSELWKPVRQMKKEIQLIGTCN